MQANRRISRYPHVPDRPDYPALEAEILAFWTADHTFEASVEQRRAADEYVFYDGPPFANGLPHYGHLLTGFVKDAVPRYQTMRGRRVDRRFGWDCHGLPAETEAEKELGVSGRGPITEYGIEAFNDYCRTSVLRYTHAWERYVNRQARWVDFVHDYKTMDLTYMESVMWAFAELHRRGLIYEGYRVLPYCWECETPLSNFETRQDDAYRERIDPAVTVAFTITADESKTGPGAGELRALVWTTTPWTLPSNLALAVGPDLTYALYQRAGVTFVVGKGRADAYAIELEGAEHIGDVSGASLVGRHFRPLLPYYQELEGTSPAFSVLGAEFVADDEGTGIVHMAPGFGEDDQRVCEENGIAVVCPVDDRARFVEPVNDLVGQQVFDANEQIIAKLEDLDVLVRREEYSHSYPHCWRTETPLIYRAVSSFFVEVTAIKERLLETNQQISWAPEHVRDGAFGKWLEGARDWSISRNRFWGSPIPVWKSDDPNYPPVDVYGSLDELEADFGVRPGNLHRPMVDELTRPNPDDPSGKATMRRVTDVFDCWFESGSMPFAQLHYPFENAERFEQHFPADFICEYIGQTRGWFYTLHVLATALFDRPAFSNCIAHGVLLGNDSRKLSKRLRNYPDPEAFFEQEGADAMRWYLLSSPVLRGLDVVLEEQAMTEPIRQVLNPIFNSWHFLSLYGEIDEMTGSVRTDQKALLDRYILAKTASLVDEVTAGFERYDLAGAANAVESYLDALTNWYVRRSRERFWSARTGDDDLDADKKDAYDTLHTVLEVLSRLTAPLLPYLAETVYQGLTGERSVHLANWPYPGELPSDPQLVVQMDAVREICSAAHSIRKANGVPVRHPLATLIFAGPSAAHLSQFASLIKDEVNVKEVLFEPDADRYCAPKLSLVPAALGPRLGGATQSVLAAFRAGSWQILEDGSVQVGDVTLEQGEYTLDLSALEGATTRILEGDGGAVLLDLAVTAELADEGRVRDIVRVIQQARKDAGLHVTDKIGLSLSAPSPLRELLEGANEEIKSQTLASSLSIIFDDPSPNGRAVQLGDDETIYINLAKSEEGDAT